MGRDTFFFKFSGFYQLHKHFAMNKEFLKKALIAAASRRGFCAPNPAVGAVVVKDGKILATGCHWAAGEDHADSHKKLSRLLPVGGSLTKIHFTRVGFFQAGENSQKGGFSASVFSAQYN